jgi:hypothetical protein
MLTTKEMTTRIVGRANEKRADKVLTEVKALLADVKKNPTRYFKFSVF